MAPTRLKLCGSNSCFEDGIETLTIFFRPGLVCTDFVIVLVLFGRGAGILNEAMLR